MSTRLRSNRRFFAVFLLSALLIAGVASYYASSHPDGLNFVAEKTGFIDQEKQSPPRTARWPATRPRASTTTASAAGSPASPAACWSSPSAAGLFWVLRRRDPDTDTSGA